MTADFLRGVPKNVAEAALVTQTLVELKLMKLGIPYESIQTMNNTEIGLYLGVSTALEEKEHQDQQAAQRVSNAKMRAK